MRLTFLLSFLLLFFPHLAIGQARYPVRPITVILPVASGSSGDIAFRALGAKMEARLGQPLVFENLPGAGGLLGVERVRRAPADGYTLLGGNDSGLLYTSLLNPNAAFDPLKAFEPVTQAALIDVALVVNATYPAKSVGELVKLAKEKPGKVDFASGGPASPQQVIMELFSQRAGIRLTHIPFKGATPAITAVAAGDVPVMFQGIAALKPYLQSGHLRALATTGLERSALLPDVPTVAESGFPGFSYSAWLGFLAPVNTPRDVIQSIQRAAAEALSDPALRASYARLGLTPIGNTPDEFRRNMAVDYKRISGLVSSGTLKVD